MSRHLHESPQAFDWFLAGGSKAPLGRLSCPHLDRELAAPAGLASGRGRFARPVGCLPPLAERRTEARRGAGRSWGLGGAVTTDYWNPPRSAGQYARQRILVVVVGFVLAAVSMQVGW